METIVTFPAKVPIHSPPHFVFTVYSTPVRQFLLMSLIVSPKLLTKCKDPVIQTGFAHITHEVEQKMKVVDRGQPQAKDLFRF